MRKITLHAPHVDQHGRYRDAGSVLIVGAAGKEDADVTAATADDLLERGVAVTMTEAREIAGDADPLDHDQNGAKGGSLPHARD